MTEPNKRFARLSPRKRGLRFTLSLSFTLASIILMIALSYLLVTRFNSATTANAKDYSTRLLSQVNTHIDAVLRDAMRTSDNLYYQVLKRYDLQDETTAEQFKLIYDTAGSSLVSQAVFAADGTPLLTQPYSKVKSTADPTSQTWFQSASSSIANVHFSTPHVQDLFEDPDGSYKWVISVSRSVELTDNGRVSQGVLLLDLNFSAINQILRNVDAGSGSRLYMTDRSGQLLYHPRLQLISAGLDSEATLAKATQDDNVYEDSSSDSIITVQTVGYTGWKLVLVTPLQTVVSSPNEVQAFTMLFILLAIALVILVNFLISSGIARPIKELEEQVTAYEKGEIKAISEGPSSSPEIVHLSTAIISLVTQQEVLRENIVREQEAKRRSELEALQAQIHPHFLYNTLDSIVWMIENKRYDGAVDMVTSLARFFRLSLAKGKSITTVANELEQIRYYLNIQQIRFRGQFTYETSLAEDVAECRTIKLIVQPLVENAIYHGTSKLDGDGKIRVSAYGEEDRVYIDVEDNGLGMSAEMLQMIADRQTVGHSSSSGSGIGIANVDERIRLFFGEEYGLSIFSVPDEGTLIRIRLPRIYEDPEAAKP